MEGDVYIEGQIGTSYKDDGTVDVKGVELQDVISQVRKNEGAEKISCYINSQGGLVDVGRKIAKYIGSLPNVYTIADGKCASIATEIHLSVPVERRKMVAGTDYHIHQPMFSIERGIALNKDQLSMMSSEIGKTQGEMVSMYAKATGMDKVSLEALMEQQTSLTDDQCKEFGFVSEVISSPFKAVALLKTNNQKDNQMSELKEEVTGIKSMLKNIGEKIAALAEPAKKVSLDVTTEDGVLLVIVTEDDTPAVGDGVMLEDGSNAEDGTYETPMGQIVVADGAISEYTPSEGEEETFDMEALKTENETLRSENEEIKVALESLKDDVTRMAKLTSNYKPKKQAVAFRKEQGDEEKDSYNAIKEAQKAKRKNK